MTYSSCPPRTGIMIAANEKRGKNPLWVSYLDQGLSERLGGLAAVGATQFPVCAGMTKQRPISRYMCICIHIYIYLMPPTKDEVETLTKHRKIWFIRV